MLQMAIPNKGALSEDAVRLLQEAGYRCSRSGRELIVRDQANEIDFVFLRPRDIALYVGNGVLDLGITGRDLEMDSGAAVTEVMPLEFGRSRFCFAVPKDSGLTVEKLDGLRIATSYPELLRQNLEKFGLKCPIVKLDGAVEISIRLGVADAIADVVESGATLKEAGLAVIGEPMLHSEAVLVSRSAELADRPEVHKLVARIKGILVARTYAMIEYDIPRASVEAACRITPGIEAPTVSPLSNPDWVAVKAMVLCKQCNGIMDELYEIGARGIIVTDIRSCRL
ncbi:ATP phosphoribosyltransferase [Victivallis vadensis]|uniref:ATP phosphoribosyltransferase n=1 Tax=Victivallis vadensis TaxID=172901 RepID=A0A2U1B4R9_9BACT|nr:ATP phosphoribosyltransferase [Victivallis vadensis]PVY43517.1 ATP phosphoribosyltransferase (homohexameric) [Victivallis vadensis]PWM81722.1 MAG: ATP phosphoribosyltransferase [Lentisphaerota bacterium]